MIVGSQESQRELLDDVARQCRASLAFYSRVFWPIVEPGRLYVDGWHIDALAEHLQAVFERQLRELAIAMPPRHMKSLMTSVMFPTWVWARQPTERFIYGSYDEGLCTRDALKSRRIIQSPLYQALFGHSYQLTGDQNQKTRYENDRTGYRLTTSVGGGSTGEGGDIVVGDDLMKATDADKDVKLKAANEFWWNGMATRMNDPKTFCRVLVMQRLNEKDPVGNAIDRGYTLLKLPARYAGEQIVTPLGWHDPRTKEGELLWPGLYDEKSLARLEKDIGSARQVAGQLQQEPSPLQGSVFKREWWRYYEQVPAQFDKVVTSWDLNYDEGVKNDFVVGQAWGRLGANKYLLGQYRERVGFTEQLRAFKMMKARFPQATAHFVEKKANGSALIDTLKNHIEGIIPVNPTASKLNRAEAIADQMEAGNVWLPKNEPWVQEYVEEHTKFPGGRNDDQVDATSQALAKLAQRKALDLDADAMSLTKSSMWR